jgi:hypothetical protein
MLINRLLLIFISISLIVITSVGLDRVAGLFSQSHDQGIIFPRKVTLTLATREFSSTVKTNSMGFRAREFVSQKTARTRIVALGDSFTFGWGVNAEESWPKLLEEHLKSSGLDVEIDNLGRAGGSPTTYADIAEKSVDLLHPDLLIVGILQGDDLAQMGLPPVTEFALGQDPHRLDITARHPRLRSIAKRLYPHFLTMLDQRESNRHGVADDWQQIAQSVAASCNAAERSRLDQLDERVKKAFFAGELNPSLVYLSLHMPDYFMQTMDLSSATTKLRISHMAEQLARIKSAAERNHARVLVVAVPYGIYVSRASFETRQSIGFTATTEMLTSNAADEAIRQASQSAAVEFYEVTEQFRRSDQEFFFPLDGHLNRTGHAYFADVVTPIVRTALTGSNK